MRLLKRHEPRQEHRICSFSLCLQNEASKMTWIIGRALPFGYFAKNKMARIEHFRSQVIPVGKYPDPRIVWEEALEIARRLYSKTSFPDGHANLAFSLSNLAFLSQTQGKYADAEPLFRDSLNMYKRLFKGDHPAAAISINN